MFFNCVDDVAGAIRHLFFPPFFFVHSHRVQRKNNQTWNDELLPGSNLRFSYALMPNMGQWTHSIHKYSLFDVFLHSHLFCFPIPFDLHSGLLSGLSRTHPRRDRILLIENSKYGNTFGNLSDLACAPETKSTHFDSYIDNDILHRRLVGIARRPILFQCVKWKWTWRCDGEHFYDFCGTAKQTQTVWRWPWMNIRRRCIFALLNKKIFVVSPSGGTFLQIPITREWSNTVAAHTYSAVSTGHMLHCFCFFM